MSNDDIVDVFTNIKNSEEMKKFFHEILSPREIADLELRWQLLKELHSGETQRSIAARHHISLCKITRGSKLLKSENSTVKKILDSGLS